MTADDETGHRQMCCCCCCCLFYNSITKCYFCLWFSENIALIPRHCSDRKLAAYSFLYRSFVHSSISHAVRCSNAIVRANAFSFPLPELRNYTKHLLYILFIERLHGRRRQSEKNRSKKQQSSVGHFHSFCSASQITFHIIASVFNAK